MLRRVVITFPSRLGEPGGGPIGCMEIARGMAQAGMDVALVQVGRGDWLNQADESLRARVLDVRPSRLHYLLDCIPVFEAVHDLSRRSQIDAVLSFAHEGALLPRFLRRRQILFGMIAAQPDYQAWLSRRTSCKMLKSVTDHLFRVRPLRTADVVFALSDFTRSQLIEILGVPPKNARTAYWGVDQSFLAIRRRERQTCSRFVFFGSLAANKGVFDAVQALGKAGRKGIRGWKLRVAGWGDVDAVLRAARAEGIEADVEFLGNLSHDQLSRLLGWADLAILPSHVESFGLAIAEAQAAGLPVVSYEGGAVPEVVDNGRTGWLVALEDIDALAEVIVAAIGDPREAYQRGMSGRERVKRLFSWERTARQMLAALSSM
jgi:glycosyltransferase involved in cell wall biosynthesis